MSIPARRRVVAFIAIAPSVAGCRRSGQPAGVGADAEVAPLAGAVRHLHSGPYARRGAHLRSWSRVGGAARIVQARMSTTPPAAGAVSGMGCGDERCMRLAPGA